MSETRNRIDIPGYDYVEVEEKLDPPALLLSFKPTGASRAQYATLPLDILDALSTLGTGPPGTAERRSATEYRDEQIADLQGRIGDVEECFVKLSRKVEMLYQTFKEIAR